MLFDAAHADEQSLFTIESIRFNPDLDRTGADLAISG